MTFFTFISPLILCCVGHCGYSDSLQVFAMKNLKKLTKAGFEDCTIKLNKINVY